MTQLAMLDEEKEDREIPAAFVPQLRDYGLAGDSARNDTARGRQCGTPTFWRGQQAL